MYTFMIIRKLTDQTMTKQVSHANGGKQRPVMVCHISEITVSH